MLGSNRLTSIDVLADCLTAGIEQRRLDDDVARLIRSSLDVDHLASLAGRHLVTPMLADCCASAGLRDCLPLDFIRYLDVVHEQNIARNTALRAQLAALSAALNRIDIEPVLLKGGIRLADSLYPSIGWRFMRDLDILVAPERLMETVACLEDEGYGFTEPLSEWPDQHRHLPPLYRDGDGAVVELHTELLARHRNLCPASEVLANATPVKLDGSMVRIPSTADQLGLLIGHDLTDGFLRRSSMLRLRSLFETALLARDRTAIETVLERADGAVGADLRVALGLAALFFPNQLAALPESRLGTDLRIWSLSAMEHLDANGRFRRFVWFVRLRLSKLLHLPTERRYIARSLLSPSYYRRCSVRLRRLWLNE